ncbi:MAG: helix-turn-helix transcriptional regulator [Candidatus Omnitrophota bacterium]|nr:MAG: helix-turn-helix transcriptional regulator [Candidatus Omnitrophota bacterium]
MENAIQEFKRLHEFYGGFAYQTKKLAEYLGVSTRTIQRWMKGKTAPSEEETKKIKAYLTAKRASSKGSDR